MKTKRNLPFEKLFLVLLILWGAALRLYNFFSIPFTHDEFSALFRTHFQSFSELIEKGVLVDFHPAGIQVFLTYYGRLFGFEEWVLKLPFALVGIACIYLCYKIGKEWFNAHTGLLLAAFVANTQFFIFHSQTARPYIAGLFFGLLAFLYCKRMLYDGEKVSLKNMTGWILAVTFSAYVHYYLLLSLLLFAIVQLIFAPSRRRPIFILSGLIIFALYLPHLALFLKQLSKGGIESWLGKPQPNFLIHFGEYLFHYSSYFLSVIGILLVVTVVLTFSKIRLNRFWWISISSFFASFFVGYWYSLQVSAILQFSGLLFTAPLLLAAIFNLLSQSRVLFAISLVSIVGLGNYSLIKEREHYRTLYESPYEQIVKETKTQLDHNSLETLIILDNRSDILTYYLDKYELENNDQLLLTDNNWSPAKLDHLLQQTEAKQLIVGHFVSSPFSWMNVALHRFPTITHHKNYYHGEFYVLTKDVANSSKTSSTWNTSLSLSKPKENDPYWGNLDNQSIGYDSILGEPYFQFKASSVYGLKMELQDIGSFQLHPNSFIDVKAEIIWNTKPSETYMATAAYMGDSLIKWHTSPLSKFYKHPNEKQWVYHSFPLNGLPEDLENVKLHSFFYNPSRNDFRVYGLEANLRTGNPRLYGLYKPIFK